MNENTCVVHGVKYSAVSAHKDDSCIGCVADTDAYLCQGVDEGGNNCMRQYRKGRRDVIWVKDES